MRRLPLVAAAAAFIALILASPALAVRGPLTALPDARVGKIAGTRAFVGLSLDRGRVRAYVCDGTLKRDATISQWFKGRWDGSSALALTAGGLELRVDAGGRTGELIQDGTSNTLRLRSVTAPAGLFERRRRPLRSSWIVLPDRSMRGTFVSPRPPRCRMVLVTGSSGQQQWVTVC
jgi:hypothetical protein